MRIYLHYTIWNKGAHIPWLCEGIRSALPTNTVLDFTFENCTDSSLENFKRCLSGVDGYGDLSKYQVTITESKTKYRWPNTNEAMKRFLQSDCDVFLSPQDDQQIQDKRIFNNLTKLFHNEKPGFVGMRDGVGGVTDTGHDGHYYSSNFSRGLPSTIWLNSGDYREVIYVNDGPIALTKETINKVGYFDLGYWAHYADNDYSFRCDQAGLKVFVMGAEIVHEKWSCKVCGGATPSEVWTQEFSSHDWNHYLQKWPHPRA